jgi:2,4-dienoyl-CoA reductase-like NADH-dependent reductase (Old Yellow Enzyme family)
MPTPHLLTPVTFRAVTARNRIAVAPMCQYSAIDGLGDDWHVQHLGARAMGGAGIVFTEATHVAADARITPGCLGLYNDAHEAFLARVVKLIEYGGAVPGIQLAHAGRKASTLPPWDGVRSLTAAEGAWETKAPSAIPFGEAYATPTAFSANEIAGVIEEFAASAARAARAGFKIAELHSAHGYLGHEFLSPISNRRTDAWGGDLAGRGRFLMEMIEALRGGAWPDDLPIFVRLSCTDWMPGGLTLEDSIILAKRLKETGKVDLIDCSSGGILAKGPVIPSLHPGYQVPFADAIRNQAGIATGAVGLITSPQHAEEILANDRADLVLVARAVLQDPAWPLRAARALGGTIEGPRQYGRGTLT